MRLRFARGLLAALLGLAACQAGGGIRSRPVEPAQAARPRLVVAVVLDQLPSWALGRHLARLPKDGLIRRAMSEGVWHPRVRYPFGATLTAAGHATLHTGVQPRVHGVVANDRYDAERGEKRALVDDGEHLIFGVEGFAGPSVLRVPTVADGLKAATEGAGRVVALSLKDRAAILPGGARPDFVAFYDKRLGAFTSSAYYFDALPGWFEAWREAHPLENYLEVWRPLEVTRATPGMVDDRPVEGVFVGFDRTFPHDPREGDDPKSLFRFTPGSTRALLDLARASVDELELGADAVPDLLSISVSATDYVGHAFGADSMEYLDNLIRTDRMLAAFVRELEARTSVAVLITSDHGAAPLPTDPSPPRISPEALVVSLNAALAADFGEGQHVVGYHVPYMYLSPEARRRTGLVEAVLARLTAMDTVARAVRSSEAAGWVRSRDATERALALGIDVARGGAIYVLPAEGVVVDPNLGGGGTTHGTPYDYDVEVPVLALGAGISSVRSIAPLDTLQVAPSLAALLGVPPPEGARAPPLPGVGPAE